MRISVLSGALLVVVGLGPLAARPLFFDEQKCQVEIPDQWIDQHVAEDQASFINGDQTKSFVLRVVQTGTRVTLDNPAFIKGFEESAVSHSGTISSRKREKIAGVDAYTIETSETVPMGTAENATTVLLANGFAYGLARSKLNASPAEDAELNGIVSSFQFSGEPQLHESSNNRLSFRLGQVAGVALAVVAGLLIIRWLRKRPGARPSARLT